MHFSSYICFISLNPSVFLILIIHPLFTRAHTEKESRTYTFKA